MDDIQKDEVRYYMYNYLKIDKLMQLRREQIMDEGNVSYYEWYTQNKSVDDIVYELEEDILIMKYKNLKKAFNIFLNILLVDRKIEYIFFKYKYIKKYDNEKLKDIFKDYDINVIDNKLIILVFNIIKKIEGGK